MTPSQAEAAPAAATQAGPQDAVPRHLAVLLGIAGLVGLVAAATLLTEKIKVLADPDYVPSCSLNPVLSCGSVLNTPQAEAFGFPNPIIGIAGFAITLTVGVAVIAGARLAGWFWLGLLAGATFGAVFVHWLIFQSLYRIGALCPYCMVVWAVTIPIFWYTLLHVVAAGHLRLPSPVRRVVRGLGEFHAVVLTVWFLGVVALITVEFWSYWRTLIT